MRNNKLLLALAAVAYFILLFAPPAHAERILAQVAWVTDGDTFVIAGHDQKRVRLSGIDAPEVAHAAGERDQPYGEAAKHVLMQWLHGK